MVLNLNIVVETLRLDPFTGGLFFVLQYLGCVGVLN